jgi:CO/xanthine dehydrogenase Mo-binding subunit/aerobic-type carbon monoxide dehydrogenase small subunit (CoxS/CutS family)
VVHELPLRRSGGADRLVTRVAFELNGGPVIVDVEPGQTLLSVIRDVLDLTGTKRGCDSGECGACTVLVDGRARRSCHVRAESVAGARVETIEGLSTGGDLHPLQEAFLAEGAIQCGFCTPGMIMAAKGLLDRGGDVDRSAIEAALRHNVCRCTGYTSIVDAITRAAARTRDSLLGDQQAQGVRDAESKATGRALFAGDLRRESMLHGAVVWSTVPHGCLRGLDASAASELPGVVAVLTADDIPGVNGIGLLRPDQPVLVSDFVRRVGDSLALVVAETDEVAREACRQVRVDIEALPSICSAREALIPGAPALSPDGNLLKEFRYADGDVVEGLQRSAVTVSGHFTTPFVEHAYLETEATLADIDSTGAVSVWTGTQYPFETREQIAQVLGLPDQAVQLTVTSMGGAFGGKTDMHVSVALAALAAHHLDRPVSVVMERGESIASSTKRHAFEMDYVLGLDGDGHILAVDVEVLSDAGPYSGQSPWVMEQACIFACGPYRVPTSRVRGRVMRTNNCSGGAFRGYGINQVAFALESLLDEAAVRLGIDPVELRARNLLQEGDRTPAGETLQGHVAALDTLRACREAIPRLVPSDPPRPGWSRGVGVACAYKNVGWGRGSQDDGHARIQLGQDGTILMWTSAADMGQGAGSGLTLLAAEALRLAPALIRIMPNDTECLPRGNGGSAQRLTFCAGNAVLAAARSFRARLLEEVEKRYGLPAAALKPAVGDALTYLTSAGEVRIALGDLASALEEEGTRLAAQETYIAPRTYSLDDRDVVPTGEYRLYPAYSYCTSLAVVEVEQNTGRVRVVDLAVFQDVGHAIDPEVVKGQIEGCCIQAMGYALTEQYRLETCIPQTLTLGSLGLPELADVPRYHAVLIESADPNGPTGAKGVSEVAMVPACPAIANAIAQATGVRGFSLPLRPRGSRRKQA